MTYCCTAEKYKKDFNVDIGAKKTGMMKPGTALISDDDKTTIQGILTYWFPPAGYDRHTSYPPDSGKRHWAGGAEVDTYCRQNYEALLE